jgi:hypothetical protein
MSDTRNIMDRKDCHATSEQKTSFEVDTSEGIGVIYNRNEAQIPEVELLGDLWRGDGCWHWGWKDGDQCVVGYKSAEDALDSMDNYVWALIHEQGDWRP